MKQIILFSVILVTSFSISQEADAQISFSFGTGPSYSRYPYPSNRVYGPGFSSRLNYYPGSRSYDPYYRNRYPSNYTNRTKRVYQPPQITPAEDLWTKINSVCWEAHNHHQEEENYLPAYTEIRGMLETVSEIKELFKDSKSQADESNIKRVNEILLELDKKFYEVEQLISSWDSHYLTPGEREENGEKYIDQGGIKLRLAILDETLHLIMRELNKDSSQDE